MAEVVRTDVCIVGAGPGGCCAALQLGKHGVKAVLVDKATFPRDKVCGDALSGKVLRILDRLDPDLGRSIRAERGARPSWGVTFVAPNGKALRVPFTRKAGTGAAPGFVWPRLELDHMLLSAVKSAGRVSLREGSSASHFQRDAHGWVIGFANSEDQVHARLIMDASGANSAFARHHAGIPLDLRHHCAGVRAYFSGVEGLDREGFIELHFLRDLLPGYLWVFPLENGRANVGLGLRSDIVRKRKVDLKELLSRTLATHPLLRERFAGAQMSGAIQGMGLPLGSKRHAISGPGYLLLGDAAHLIDPFTGEGISHAMISGVHAADVAAESLSRDRLGAHALAEYDRRVWNRLGRELSISTRLQQLVGQPWLFNFVVGRALKNPALADTIGSMFTDLDMRERLRRPGYYIRLLLG